MGVIIVGANWAEEKLACTYNSLFVRAQNTQTSPPGFSLSLYSEYQLQAGSQNKL